MLRQVVMFSSFLFNYGPILGRLKHNDLGDWRTFFYGPRDWTILSKHVPSELQPQPGGKLPTSEVVKVLFP